MDIDSWVKKCREIVVESRGRGRQRKTWDHVIEAILVLNKQCGEVHDSKMGSLLSSRPV